MEKSIQFDSQGLLLEGLIAIQSGDKGVVVTHPHPLYGGNMYNNVVESIVRAYLSKGYTTLRFNFRGVGNSQGDHDNGMGELNDVRSAMSVLKDNGLSTIDLAGYSFGSWIHARVVGSETDVGRLIMISPPVAFVDFDSIGELEPLKLVITGTRDDIAPVDMIRKNISVWNKDARLEEIEGADHFYSGYDRELELALSSVL